MNTKKSNNLVTQSDNLETLFNDKFLLINQSNLSKKYYQNILAYDLILKQNYTSIMQLTRIEKISLNTTSKSYVVDKKYLLFTLAALELISGQKPQLTYAKKSVANFKIRQHQILGCKVVLRKTLMYAFLERLSKIIFPRIRDSSKQKYIIQTNQPFLFAKKKNSTEYNTFTFGLKNLMIFPELENHFQLVDNFRGMNLTFVLRGFNNKKFLNHNNKVKQLLLVLSGFQLPF